MWLVIKEGFLEEEECGGEELVGSEQSRGRMGGRRSGAALQVWGTASRERRVSLHCLPSHPVTLASFDMTRGPQVVCSLIEQGRVGLFIVDIFRRRSVNRAKQF